MLVEVMADTAATSDTVDGEDMVGLVVMVDTAAMVDPVITNKMAATVVMEVKVLVVAMSRLVKVFIDTNIFFIKDLMRYGPNIVHCMQYTAYP
jgi:hypothetical protein